jgi:hypothetical protein
VLAALILVAGIIIPGDAIASDAAAVPRARDYAELGAQLEELQETIAALEELTVSGKGNITREDKQECSFNEMNTLIDWTNREERRTAFCVVRRWSVPGGLSQLISVGDCESGWWRFAYNDNGHAGLFQHDTDSWDYRVNTYEPKGWELKKGWANSRSQIVVTARMAHDDGDWGQWSGCA